MPILSDSTYLAMRTLLTGLIVLLVGLFAPTAAAQPTGIGVGAQIAAANDGGPAPVGLSVKTWVNNRQAVTGATSFRFAEGDTGSPSFWILEANYLFHNFEPLTVEEGALGLYVGPGVQLVATEGADDVAFRGPIGVNYIFETAPADLFIEVAPTLQVTDPSMLRFDGAIGFRYFFTRGEER